MKTPSASVVISKEAFEALRELNGTHPRWFSQELKAHGVYHSRFSLRVVFVVQQGELVVGDVYGDAQREAFDAKLNGVEALLTA